VAAPRATGIVVGSEAPMTVAGQDQGECERRRRIIEDARATVARLAGEQPKGHATRHWSHGKPIAYTPQEQAARQEHAWLLRAEGYTLRQIADRLGVSNENARLKIWQFGSRVQRAIDAMRIAMLFRAFAAIDPRWRIKPADGWSSGLSHEQWFALPLQLRRCWWLETEYGTKPPSDALWRTIHRQLNFGARPVFGPAKNNSSAA
jgi:hypothetical protein